jgi:hypothetical protein
MSGALEIFSGALELFSGALDFVALEFCGFQARALEFSANFRCA